MRKLAKSIVAFSAAGAVVAYLGFPSRLGLTKAQAAVSMPGDLILPAADVQADRAATVVGTARELWPSVSDLKTVYEGLYDIPLAPVYRQAPNLVVWEGTRTVRDSRHEEDLFRVTVAVTMNPESVDSTFVHVRERYRTSSGRRGRMAALTEVTTTAAVVGGLLSKMRRAARKRTRNEK